MIKCVVKLINKGKNDGYDGLSSDYIINGTQLFYKYISVLFTLMLKYYYVPNSIYPPSIAIVDFCSYENTLWLPSKH